MKQNKTPNITIFIDGASRGNPGPGAVGVAIYNSDTNEQIRVYSQRTGDCTNNEAEYMAMIAALCLATQLSARVLTIKGDSKLILSQMEGKYKIKKESLRYFYNQAQKLVPQFEHISYVHIHRELNTQADALANAALDSVDNL